VKVVAAIFADFAHTFLGAPSAFLERLGERTVLEHTLRRALRIEGLARVSLVVRPRDADSAAAALRSFDLERRIDLIPDDDGLRPRRSLIRSARVWNLDAWRGSPLGTTCFDEFVEPRSASRVLERYGCDALLCLDGHQPLLDPHLAQRMLAHGADQTVEARFVFTQAPPGLAGILLSREALADLLELDLPVGLLVSYRPDAPRADPIARAECARVDTAISHLAARLTADTLRSRARVASAFAALGEDCDAEAVCRWVAQTESYLQPGDLPREIEIELTSQHPLPHSRLRPGNVPARDLESLDALHDAVRQLARYDDALVVLAGHGDPLLHRNFAEACHRVRQAGAAGLAVATSLVTLTQEALDALHEAPVDLLEVKLDANRAATYGALHGRDCFAVVLENIARVQQSRVDRQCPQPIIAASLSRHNANQEEIEAFFDRWTRTTGWAVLRGYNDYAGRLPPDGLLSLCPPVREPCRRLARRMTLLADGQVPLCSQDFRPESSLGDWRRTALADLWSGFGLQAARDAHSQLRLAALPLCDTCRDWFRP
jgi:spiro-SPASM protein